MYERALWRTEKIMSKIRNYSAWILSTCLRFNYHMFYWVKMQEYIEICNILRLKLVTENLVIVSLSIHFKHWRVNFDLFNLVEFCLSSNVFESKLERPQRKVICTLDKANYYLLKTISSGMSWCCHIFYPSYIALNMKGW